MQRMYVVRFVTDCGFYAKGEEAAFPEEQAMGLQKKGYAISLGLAEEVAGPKAIANATLTAETHGIAAALVEDDTSKRQRARV